ARSRSGRALDLLNRGSMGVASMRPRGAAFRGGTHARKDLSTPAKDLAGADVLKIFRPVHIRKLARIGLDDDGTELDESVREPELLLLETSLEHRQGDAGDGRREWASRRDRRLVARIAEGADELRSHEWDIDRKEDRDRVGRRAEAGDDPGERGSEVGSVVENRERELELVRLLADGDPLVAGLAEDPPRAFGQRLVVEPGQ